MRTWYKIFVVIAFWAWVALIGVQQFMPFLPAGKALAGTNTPPVKPCWSLKDVRSGCAMLRFEDQFNWQFHLKPWLVRLDNEVCIRVFHESYLRPGGTTIVVGRQGQLHELGYVRDAIRPSPLTPETAQARVQQMVRVQRLLQAHGMPCVFVIAPSKAQLLPDTVPKRFWWGRHPDQVETAYEQLAPLLKNAALACVDSHALFEQWGTSDLELFPETGAHWSYHGAWRILSQIADSLNQQGMNPDLHIPTETRSTCSSPKQADKDLAELINRLHPAHLDYRIAYPELAPDRSLPKGPSILWVASSYAWNFTHLVESGELTSPSVVAYYWNTLVSVPGGQRTPMKDVDLSRKKFWGRFDGIVVVVQENALADAAWGFFDYAEREFSNPAMESQFPETPWVLLDMRLQPLRVDIDLGAGLAPPDPYGIWTTEPLAHLRLNPRLTTDQDIILEMEFLPFWAAEHPRQRFNLFMGEHVLGEYSLTNDNREDTVIRCRVPAAIWNAHRDLTLHLLDACSPKSLGLSEDTRLLGIALRKLTARRATETDVR